MRRNFAPSLTVFDGTTPAGGIVELFIKPRRFKYLVQGKTVFIIESVPFDLSDVADNLCMSNWQLVKS